ncbi:hypothetical protein DMA11_19280 [Marinilabiliaceae bacterium JC017]|nr:hypothetical protein DMA11_19280 [Marinilabiliaceae bacterium JC017]
MTKNSNFNFSLSELAQRGDKTTRALIRDAERFLEYGYNDTMRDKIIAIIILVKEFPTDDYFEGMQKMKTNIKNMVREKLENDINDLRNRARLVFGHKSIEYSLFRFTSMTEMTDSEMVRYALHVIKVAEPRLELLAKRQVTQENLDSIRTHRSNLDEAIDEQSSAISLRKEKSLERNKLANDLYKLISEICEAGKMMWKGVNEAYYTDYVIYGSSKSMAEQVEEEITDEQ